MIASKLNSRRRSSSRKSSEAASPSSPSPYGAQRRWGALDHSDFSVKSMHARDGRCAFFISVKALFAAVVATAVMYALFRLCFGPMEASTQQAAVAGEAIYLR